MDISDTLIDKVDEVLKATRRAVDLDKRLDGIAEALNKTTKALQRREEPGSKVYDKLTEEESEGILVSLNAAADAFTALRGVRKSLDTLGDKFSEHAKDILEAVREFNVRMSWAGGRVPYEPLCEYTSGEFAQDCADALGRTKLMRLKKAAQLVAKLRETRDSVHKKYEKLNMRAMNPGSDGEALSANGLIKKMKETMEMLDRRLKIVTSIFYKERLGMLTEVLSATEQITTVDNARDASVRYDAKRVLEDIIMNDLKTRKRN